MLTLFNSRSLYIGCDMKEFNRIRDLMDQHSIKYKYSVKNRMGQWNGRGTVRGNMGNAGQKIDQCLAYEILVHKKDYDKAIYLKK